MASCTDFPKTSQVRPDQFAEKYEQFYNEGIKDLIYVSISSTGSSTYNNALKSRDEFYENHPEAKDKFKITVIDSLNYTFTYGYPVIEAAAKAARGCSAEEIIAFIEEWISCTEVHFVSYTLDYVKRSGRVSAGAAFMGELLGLKPIISIIDGDIYLVSGVSDKGVEATVLQCDLETLEAKNTYNGPDELAGMVQITRIQDYYYISVSTDKTGNQDVATIVRTKSLENLASGDYEDIYSQYFMGGGTPYYISSVDDTYFLTEHRLKDHAVWSFKVEDNEITDVEPIF